jgi:hypothetical protein
LDRERAHFIQHPLLHPRFGYLSPNFDQTPNCSSSTTCGLSEEEEERKKSTYSNEKDRFSTNLFLFDEEVLGMGSSQSCWSECCGDRKDISERDAKLEEEEVGGEKIGLEEELHLPNTVESLHMDRNVEVIVVEANDVMGEAKKERLEDEVLFGVGSAILLKEEGPQDAQSNGEYEFNCATTKRQARDSRESSLRSLDSIYHEYALLGWGRMENKKRCIQILNNSIEEREWRVSNVK